MKILAVRFRCQRAFPMDLAPDSCHLPGAMTATSAIGTRVAVGSDHGGFELKSHLSDWLVEMGYTVYDAGTTGTDSVDYPEIAYAVAREVALGRSRFGIVVDGAGIGSGMTANKVLGVRAAACYNEALASNARRHNDANVLTLGAVHTSLEEARKIVQVFLREECTEERHRRRVQMITDLEQGRSLPLPAPSLESEGGQAGLPATAPSVPGRQERLNLSPEDAQRVTHRVRQLLAPKGIVSSAGAPAGLTAAELGGTIDHTLLKPEASGTDVAQLCREAVENGFFSVCVNSGNVREAAPHLRGTPVKLCSVVGFPLGAVAPEIKALEARKAIREGADEIDMVINVGALKSGTDEVVLEDIRVVVEACKERGKLCKVILETALLTDEEKVLACQLSIQAGADFVKTSTGFGPGGATVQDVALMSSVVASHHLGVKASGGVRGYADAVKMIEAGATRIGASSGLRILQEARDVESGKKRVTGDEGTEAY